MVSMTPGTGVLAAAAVIPVVVLVLFVVRGIRHVDRETVQAAQTLGMSRRAILHHVILPQARKRILIGVLLAVVIAAVEAAALLYYGLL